MGTASVQRVSSIRFRVRELKDPCVVDLSLRLKPHREYRVESLAQAFYGGQCQLSCLSVSLESDLPDVTVAIFELDIDSSELFSGFVKRSRFGYTVKYD
ncbi:hypothetical protein Mp_7g16210 [Marchantia polymorpha subsp. ruderalis]|uniref:Uncharacterized protein n=2 Tax=Marchantia polymorpha TaxID=3197 RepID=A0AAF6C0A0_MARPO|nr:hypothetical protein MARPO_0123s0002 [Marchantia polymorpha]BBN17684.1 hypothetical protein Mp_7g16210 [Marchantia polymorpha subsp. ruderalis]|eukprot:PTQ30506.1 hypothetical protein MARPO_0123s0002 [Marchantia polymorpha]